MWHNHYSRLFRSWILWGLVELEKMQSCNHRVLFPFSKKTLFGWIRPLACKEHIRQQARGSLLSELHYNMICHWQLWSFQLAKVSVAVLECFILCSSLIKIPRTDTRFDIIFLSFVAYPNRILSEPNLRFNILKILSSAFCIYLHLCVHVCVCVYAGLHITPLWWCNPSRFIYLLLNLSNKVKRPGDILSRLL